MVSRQGCCEAFGLTPTRRSFLLAPALGLVPFRIESSLKLTALLPVTRLLFGGDVMLSRHVAAVARKQADPAWPMRSVAGLFSSADIAFINLESPFSDRGRTVEDGMVFKAEPEMIEALSIAGIDVVSTANNHSRDRGSHGLEFTLDLLAKAGIAAVGTGLTAEAAHQGAVLQRNGVRFGFLAYTFDQSNGNYSDRDERIAMLDADRMTMDVKSMLGRADVVTVSMHAGWEYYRRPNPWQQKFARAAIDAGASIVVGHHPHVTQTVESYANGIIFYSLGNLVFDQLQRKETQLGAIADVRFIGTRLVGYGMIPVEIVRTVPKAL